MRTRVADLMGDNAKRLRWPAALFCLGGLPWIAYKLSLPDKVRVAADIVAVLAVIAGVVLLRRAMAMDLFVRKPDPEPPPSILER